MSSPRIAKLQALLARIQSNAGKPREIAVSTLTVPPTAGAQTALLQEQHDEAPPTKKPEEAQLAAREVEQAREVEAPLESRARLVAAPQVEVEEIEAEEVLELDDRHIVTQETIVAEATQESPAVEIEEPPPSSRRPIAEPAETPQEAELNVAPPPTHTPPPESGKQVASDALSFDDDFTGVRETTQKLELPKPDQSIQLQSLRSPPVAAPPVPDDLEAEIAAPEPPDEPTRPPPGPLPASAVARTTTEAPQHEVARPTRPVAAAHVAEIPRSAPIPTPKTFGELLDLTLAL